MNKINQEINKQEWIEKIKQCRSSGLSIKKWCEINNVPQPTYYYWLKRIRTKICDTIVKEEPISLVPSIVEIDNSTVAVLMKGDIRIELSNSVSKELLTVILYNLL